MSPWPGASFVESGRTFGDEISSEMLTALDATDWQPSNLVDDPAETDNIAARSAGSPASGPAGLCCSPERRLRSVASRSALKRRRQASSPWMALPAVRPEGRACTRAIWYARC